MTTGTEPRIKATRTIRPATQAPEPTPEPVPVKPRAVRRGLADYMAAPKPYRNADGQCITIIRAAIEREIIVAVCNGCGVEPTMLAGKIRHPQVVWARSLCVRLLRVLTPNSYPKIAWTIGQPNHSSALTSNERLTEKLQAPKGDMLRMLVWNGELADAQQVIDELVTKLNTRACA